MHAHAHSHTKQGWGILKGEGGTWWQYSRGQDFLSVVLKRQVSVNKVWLLLHALHTCACCDRKCCFRAKPQKPNQSYSVIVTFSPTWYKALINVKGQIALFDGYTKPFMPRWHWVTENEFLWSFSWSSQVQVVFPVVFFCGLRSGTELH